LNEWLIRAKRNLVLATLVSPLLGLAMSGEALYRQPRRLKNI
jgi:hypothetical protein